MTGTDQVTINAALWGHRNLVRHYANRVLRPVEVVLFVRYRDELAGRVLEIGCGAGRLTGYLVQIGASVVATDVSPRMLAAARARHPGPEYLACDVREVSALHGRAFDAVVAGYGVLDVLGDEERRRVLGDIRSLLVPGGLLIMSSHNEASEGRRRSPWSVASRNPARVAANVAMVPVRLRNRARLRMLEVTAADHSLLNDEAHDFRLLHYYIAPDAQARQLSALGYTPVEALDIEGATLGPGDAGAESPEIHYVARSADTC